MKLLSWALGAMTLPAATIYEVAGTVDQLTGIASPNRGYAVGWTQNATWTGVTIEVPVITAGTASVDAYLMRQIGPGTTAGAHQVGFINFSPPAASGGVGPYTTLFSGLSLGPGSYYVVLAGLGVQSPASWQGSTVPVTTLGSGVTGLAVQCANCTIQNAFAGYLPASVFSTTSALPFVRVTGNSPLGDGGGIPEPGTMVLTALATLFTLYRRSAEPK